MRPIIGTMVGLLLFFSSFSLSANSSAEYTKAMKYLDERGELYFQFFVNSLSDINKISNESMISIDRMRR